MRAQSEACTHSHIKAKEAGQNALLIKRYRNRSKLYLPDGKMTNTCSEWLHLAEDGENGEVFLQPGALIPDTPNQLQPCLIPVFTAGQKKIKNGKEVR